MTKKITSLLSIVAITALTIGCGDSTIAEKEPSAITTATSTGTSTSTLNASQLSAGVITSPVTVSVTTSDNTSKAEVLLATGTGFEDENGNTLDNVIPKLELTQTTENSGATNKVQTKLKLTDTAGNKIIPTEPITLKTKAPSNAKPGDEVKVSLPASTNKISSQEKLAFSIVDVNGFLNTILPPSFFKNFSIIIVVFENTITIEVTEITGTENTGAE